MNQEITLSELQNDYNWKEVFGEGCGGNTDQDVESLDNTHCGVCNRTGVVDVIGAVNGEKDCEEWIGVFRMNDGRFLAAVGSCDYTGWD